MSTNDAKSSLDVPKEAHFFRSSSFTNLGHVANVAGDYHYHPTSNSSDAILRFLFPRVYSQATYNGDIRKDAPRCHPETRQSITKDLLSWAVDLLAAAFILWLTGPVGTGKSAIAQRIAVLLHEKNPRLLAGTFFFWRNDGGRNGLNLFVSTLAYQLAVAIPEAGQIIEERLSKDPSILDRATEYQWKSLIVEPLQKANLEASTERSMFIIDGLDECVSHDEQKLVLDLIATFPRSLPICFLIASRPESHIKSRIEVLCKPPSSGFRQPHLELTETEESKEDMKLILTTSFSDVVSGRRDIIGNQPWPPAEAVERIIDLADGQFVYTLTVVRFVTADDGNPVDRLNAILSQSHPAKTKAFFPLDLLYTTVLSAAIKDPIDIESPPLLLAYLSLITYPWPRGDFSFSPSVSMLSQVWGKRTAEIRLNLQPLHSVLRVPREEIEEIDVYHASFQEYLHDSSRSKKYAVLGPNSAVLASVLKQCLQLANSAAMMNRFGPDVGSLWLRLPVDRLHVVPKSKPYGDLLSGLSAFDITRWLREHYLLNGELTDSAVKRYHQFRSWLSQITSKEDFKRLEAKYPPDVFERWFQNWAMDSRTPTSPLLSQLRLANLIDIAVGDSVFTQKADKRTYISFLMKISQSYILANYPYTSEKSRRSGTTPTLSSLIYMRLTDNLLWSRHQNQAIGHSAEATGSSKVKLHIPFLGIVALHIASMTALACLKTCPADQMMVTITHQSWVFFLKCCTSHRMHIDSSSLGVHAQFLLLDVIRFITELPLQSSKDHSAVISEFLETYKKHVPPALLQRYQQVVSDVRQSRLPLLSAVELGTISEQLTRNRASLLEQLGSHLEPWLQYASDYEKLVPPGQSFIDVVSSNPNSSQKGGLRQWFGHLWTSFGS